MLLKLLVLGQPLLAAHTPMVAASPIHQQVIEGNAHAQIIAASPLHQLSDGTIVQNTLQVQVQILNRKLLNY